MTTADLARSARCPTCVMERVLDLHAVDVLATAVDHVFGAVDDPDEAVVDPGEVPGVQPPVDERRRWAQISPASIVLARYAHLRLRDRPLVWQLMALRGLDPAAYDDETFADFLLRKGQSERAIERFWDVFIRPALNLPSAEASAAMGIFTVQTSLLAGRKAGELVLPAKPLGRMHGDAARRTLERRGATVDTGVRVESLDDLDTDAVVVATPPAESARLLGEAEPGLEPSPIVSVHLVFDRPLLRTPLAVGGVVDTATAPAPAAPSPTATAPAAPSTAGAAS